MEPPKPSFSIMGYLANPGSVLEGANIQYTNSVAELHFRTSYREQRVWPTVPSLARSSAKFRVKYRVAQIKLHR